MYVKPLSKYCLTLHNIINYPANICWSWRRLQHVFSVTIFCFPRRLEEKLLHWRRLQNVFKTCLEDILKTCLEDLLKTCLEDVLKTCLEEILETNKMFTGDICIWPWPTNKSKSVSNKSISHKSIFHEAKANNRKCIN